MNGSFSRIFAIVKADFKIRFRRSSTLVIFILLCVSAYLWIPAPSTGRALLQISKQRALYNSAALSVGTASLCTILLTFIGFYMVSNSIRRDINARTGFIIASTTVTNAEYIVGKFLGNAAFLTTVAFGFMLSSMVMQVVRGEAPLEPLVFLKHYLLMIPPMIVFVSVAALVFESVRFLSGKFGDLAYFFVWTLLVLLVAVATEDPRAGSRWAYYIDTTGMGYMVSQFREVAHSDSVSIGASEFDASKPPYVFPGFRLHAAGLVTRLTSSLYPLLGLPLALLVFHRFDPTRIKLSAGKARRGFLISLNSLLKPLVAPLRVLGAPRRASLARSTVSDAVLAFQTYPVMLLAAAAFWVAASITPVQALRESVLPALFPCMALAIADIATREHTGTRSLVYSSPHLQRHFVWWKLGASLLVGFAFVAMPLVRLLIAEPPAALSLLVGTLFVTASATSLGTMTSTPKTFICAFLLFWYIALSGGKDSPGLDFAGWYGTATATVTLTYAALSVLLLVMAEAVHRLQLRRRY